MLFKFLQSFFKMGEKIADTGKTVIEHRAENDIINDKHNYKKATDIAEGIIIIAQKYLEYFSKRDRKFFEHLVKQFYKYN